MNAAELLLAGEPDAIALIEGDDSLAYGDLRTRVMRAGSVWNARGVTPGARVVIAMRDGIDWVTAFLGLVWTGALPIAVSSKAPVAQLRDLVADSGAVALLLEDEVADEFGGPAAIARGAWRAQVDAAAADAALFAAGDDEPAFLLYSSGTTGKPKGIVHAHRAVRHAHVFARDILGASAQDRFYSTSKLFFAYPLANALFAGLRLGATVVLDPEWPNPEHVAELVRRHTPTLLFSVPTLYRRMVEAGVAFPSVRAAVSAGEACPPPLAEAWREHTGIALVNGYGTTETLSLMLYRSEQMAGVAATPLTRVDVDGDSAGEHNAVRLWFSHPAVALGYSRAVLHDSARFGEHGFSPGDVFRPADEPGQWTFAGRSDQLLKVFGRWVDTVAVENRLQESLQPHVREACIVPCGTDSEDTTCLHLFVVPAAASTEAELQATLTAAMTGLPTYQRPAEVHMVSEFPRTETGKLRRGELAALTKGNCSADVR